MHSNFQIHFSEENHDILSWKFQKGLNVTIGSVKGLSPNRWQAITWTLMVISIYDAQWHYKAMMSKKLKQLECRHSENTPTGPYYPYYWIISDLKSKQDKTNLQKLPKIQILQNSLHMTHPLKLLDKMKVNESLISQINRIISFNFVQHI